MRLDLGSIISVGSVQDASYKFIFVTGPGRCGTNVLAGLIDGHPQIDVFPGEYTNFLGLVLMTNGLSATVNLALSGRYILDTAIEEFKDDEDGAEITARLERRFQEILGRGLTHLPAAQFLSTICSAFFGKETGTAVVNICNENIAGLLDVFPDCRVIHMLRNPLTQLNSRYLYRFRDVASFGGNFPGYWEFGEAFRKNYDSFRQAATFGNHERVLIVRLEDLQKDTKESMNRVFAFLGREMDSSGLNPSRRGKEFRGSRRGDRVQTTRVFAYEDDWSCLSPNDLYLCGQIKEARQFYDVPHFPYADNSYLFFLRRQLGFVGRHRKRSVNPFRILKVAVVSVAQYLQDLSIKHYFHHYLTLSSDRKMEPHSKSPRP